MFLIRKEILNALVLATTADDTRYFLNGIQITTDEDGKLTAQATDGHMLLRFKGESGEVADFPLVRGAKLEKASKVLIPTPVAKTLAGLLSKVKSSLPILGNVLVGSAPRVGADDEDRATLVITNLEEEHVVTVRQGEVDRFPNTAPLWKMRAESPSVEVTLGAEILQRLAAAAKATLSRSVQFSVPLLSEVDALGVRFGGPEVGTVDGVVMPMRDDHTEKRDPLAILKAATMALPASDARRSAILALLDIEPAEELDDDDTDLIDTVPVSATLQ